MHATISGNHMTSTEEMDKAVQAACEAAARGDAPTVMTCLNSRAVSASTGLDEPLLHMSSSARHLLDNMNDGPFHPEHALRALMSIPCCYETPWKAALSMIQAFHSQSGNLGKQSGKVLWTCVTDVQTFLQLTVEAWWKEERQRTASTSRARSTQSFPTTGMVPRQLLEQLADAILKPLNSDQITTSRDNQHWTQPLELVTTIVSICQDLETSENGGLSDRVLDRLFPSSRHSIRPDRLLPWLTLASELRSHLRSSDWTRLHAILHDSITSNTDSIPASDMPGLVRGIVSFLVKQHDEQQDWEMLILHLLYSATQDATTYSTVETVLKSNLASLPNPILVRCLLAVNSGCASVPNWICANMNLLLLQAVQQSGSQLVSSLVLRALGRHRGDGGDDLQRQCWESLKQLAFPSMEGTLDRRRKQSVPQELVRTIKTTLDGVYYDGNGQFVKDGETCGEEQNISTKLVCQSVFLGKTKPSKQSHHIFASERAQLWVHAADTILRPSMDETEAGPRTSLDALFAILIMVTVYSEVPSSRSSIVRVTIQSLSGKDNYMISDEVSSYHCVMVAMIVRSLNRVSHSGDGIQELAPIADILGEANAEDIFCDLTTALSPLPSARSSLLSISRKYLHSSFGGNLSWDSETVSRGMEENRGRVDCALHGLCTLLATVGDDESWDDCGTESWAILSDVIVQNKPALPISERSSLFRRLASLTEKKKLSLDTIEHLLRACLVRLLQFFEGDDEDSLELIPERAFVTWRSREASTEAGESFSQREDIAGLLRLVILFLEHDIALCTDEVLNATALCRGRGRILVLLSDSNLGERPEANKTVSPRGHIYLDIVCSCIAATLRSAISNKTAPHEANESQRRNGGRRIMKLWRDTLISSEIAGCKAHGMTGDPGNHVSWLKSSSQAIADTDICRVTPCDMGLRNKLLSSLCDIVMDLIFDPLWCEETEPSEVKRSCATSLIGLKRDLSRLVEGGIYIKEANFLELIFDRATLSATAAPFLDLCSEFMKSDLTQDVSLEATENVILSLLTYCTTLTQLISAKQGRGKGLDSSKCLKIARRLWNLYCNLGDERSGQRLVRYLEEEGVNQLESSSDENPPKCSFLTMKTDGDVDRIVQRVRLSVLTTLSACFQSLANSTLEMPDALCVQMLQDDSFHPDNRFSVFFLLQCLRCFSSDLRGGLDGRSGGMTEALYAAYLSLIESSCKLVSLMLPGEKETSLVLQASQAALDCAAILKDIMCNFPVKGATHFKKTMMLSTSDLPSMQRNAVLRLVASGKTRLPKYKPGFAIDLLYEMMSVTERHHRLGKLESSSWSEIAGPEHVAVSVDDERSDDESMNRVRSSPTDSSSNVVPSMIVIPIRRETRQSANLESTVDRKVKKKVQLPSKESWLWASCCSLVAMEQVFVESYSILNGNTACIPQALSTAAPSWGIFCLERAAMLSDILKVACCAMKTFEELELRDSNGNKVQSKEDVSTILALTFTDNVKLRFCMLLEKIAAVQHVALRSVLYQMKRMDDIGDVVRAETMACLSAWLNNESEELNFESLSKRWYQAEKQHSHDEGSGGIHRRLSPALRRLPKFLVRTQEIETELSKLYHVLVKVEQEGTPGRREALQQYESLLSTEEDTGESTEIDLQSMIKTKLKSLANDRASSDSLCLPLLDKEDEAGTARKRSRKAPSLEREMRRERHRNVKRSRNQIVDNWLHLDDEYEVDEGGVNDDAYVDLEDFLVDG